MFWKNKLQTSEIVNKFFEWDVTISHIKNNWETQYILKNWEYTLTTLVFNTYVGYSSWQMSLTKKWATIPLEDFEFKLFSERVKEFIRNNF